MQSFSAQGILSIYLLVDTIFFALTYSDGNTGFVCYVENRAHRYHKAI